MPVYDFAFLPLLSDMGSDVKLRGKSLEQFIREYMTSLYSTIDSLKIQSWTAIFDVLETGETDLWHCTQGKDRAGMTAALVLLALGVDKADVVDDFMMSNVYLAKSMEKRIRLANRILGEKAGDLLRPLLGVEERYIMAFFETIDRDYGGTDAFLALLDVDIQALRNHYLEPSPCSSWKPERRHGSQQWEAYGSL